jgi:putative addiction module component (TIGR02574 family)
MSPGSQEVLRQALQLPPSERAELVEHILSSFDSSERDLLDALWAAEAEERIDAHDRGEIGSSSVKDVFDRIDERPA